MATSRDADNKTTQNVENESANKPETCLDNLNDNHGNVLYSKRSNLKLISSIQSDPVSVFYDCMRWIEKRCKESGSNPWVKSVNAFISCHLHR